MKIQETVDDFFDIQEDATKVELEFINQRINAVNNNRTAVNNLQAVSTSVGDNLSPADALDEVPEDTGTVSSTGSADINL